MLKRNENKNNICMIYIIILIFYFKAIHCITEFNIHCHEICGNFKIGSTCYSIWTQSYINCISYINKKNIDVITCNNYFNYNKYELYINNQTINTIRSCKKNNINRISNDTYILISDVKNFLNAKIN